MKKIAFIPARGGSKSIPKKNIKLFCGKPLIFWNLSALSNTPEIDEIVLSTDNSEIVETVMSFKLDKVSIHHRSSENAKDDSSTESVMLEYIEKFELENSDVFMLVQATSPFTQAKDFIAAIDYYNSSPVDSLLSVVRTKRFFWKEDEGPLNYDFKNRPRRQDFNGLLMENGAFYINKVGNIRKEKNRLSGKIGFHEMPEYSSIELDEAHDWLIAEQLMKRYILTD